MGGQDSSPNEPSKAYGQSVGRGGVGNLQYAKKFEGMTDDPSPPRVGSVVSPVSIPVCFNVDIHIGLFQSATFNWPWWYR